MKKARQEFQRARRNHFADWWQRVATLRSEVERPGLTLEARIRAMGELGEALGQRSTHIDEAIYVLRESVIMAEMMRNHSLAVTNRLRLVTALEASGDAAAAALELERAQSTIRCYNLRPKAAPSLAGAHIH